MQSDDIHLLYHQKMVVSIYHYFYIIILQIASFFYMAPADTTQIAFRGGSPEGEHFEKISGRLAQLGSWARLGPGPGLGPGLAWARARALVRNPERNSQVTENARTQPRKE